MAKKTPFQRALSREDIPHVRAILLAPDDPALKAADVAWLEERGETARSEYIRLGVAFSDSSIPPQERKRLEARWMELLLSLNPTWTSFINGHGWRGTEESRVRMAVDRSHADLGYGPCAICGRSRNHARCVSRMPCQQCRTEFCWKCADTGVHGSLPDFEHFVKGAFSVPGYLLSATCCLFCQRTTWMKAHGG